MKAWHGTDRDFEEFDLSKLGTGEGLAVRGLGINAALNPEVAKYYAERCAGTTGFIMELSVPENDELLNLDASASGSVPDIATLVANYYQDIVGIDVDNAFDEAAEHDDISMSYPNTRAVEMFDRVLLNSCDESAWDELKEWSPGYGWDEFREHLGLEIDPNDNTGAQLYTALVTTAGEKTEAEVCQWFRTQYIYGTRGHEVIGAQTREEETVSIVVFDPDDIIVKSRQLIEINRQPEAGMSM